VELTDVMSVINQNIIKFEKWLKPSFFYFLVCLLLLLNILVWFVWNKRGDIDSHPEVISTLQAEKERLIKILEISCGNINSQITGDQEVSNVAPGTFVGPDDSTDGQDKLVKLLQNAAVLVSHDKGYGSGFFIDQNTIITNRHVIEGVSGSIVLISNRTIGRAINAKIISVSKASDVGSADFALLRIESNLPGIKPLSISSSQPVPLQRVVSVGFPGSGIQTDANKEFPSPIFTSGDVSAIQPQPNGVAFVVHTADISPGSSGGALVDRCGSVVGVNTFVRGNENKAEGRRLFALSGESLRQFLSASGQPYTKSEICKSKSQN